MPTAKGDSPWAFFSFEAKVIVRMAVGLSRGSRFGFRPPEIVHRPKSTTGWLILFTSLSGIVIIFHEFTSN